VHHLTLPDRKPLKVRTQSAALGDVAKYLEIEKSALVRQLFEA